ncbi:MAG: hypothetical protein BM556_18140 [Bacteriovorax sp. MedPE-SWde]|nr:MAG: hypothetical protein BM556_18140 [Bacteriovorax sp. MedPE-SWde]
MKNLALLTLLILTANSYAKVWRLGIVDSQNKEPYTTIRKHFISSLNQRGLSSGQNLEIKKYSIGNQVGAFKNIWKYYLKDKIDFLYVSGTIATIGAKKYIKDSTIPVVFAAPTDPIGIGVINNFKEGNKQFTGICYPVKVEHRLDFLLKLFPETKNIGIIYSDMPQSHSYNKWLKQTIKRPKYKGISLHFRKVQFIKSERGQERMASLAKVEVKKIDHMVDIYLAPNDQMGTQSPFAKQVSSITNKPLIGIAIKDINEGWGSTAVISPSLKDIGSKAALMIKKLTMGIRVKEITPLWPKEEIMISKSKMKKHEAKTPKNYIRYLVE